MFARDFLLEEGQDGVDLIVTGEWTSSARRAIEGGRADGIVLNYARGFRERPIDFIEGLPIRRLNLLARSVTDLSPVYTLAPTLEALRIQSDPRAVLELERLPHLRCLGVGWPQVQASIMYAKRLEDLAVAAYSEPDLTPLAPLTSLTSLSMKERPRLRSLDGMTEFPWLASLGIFLAGGLEDITPLRSASSPVLTSLQLAACKRIADIGPVAACPSLRFFDLSESGEIATAEPLRRLTQLERLYLYGSTRVSDGDLTPIAGLQKLMDFRMMNRRHYAPGVPEIQSVISLRAQTSQ